MPLFHYEAHDRTGQKVIGTMQVADETALTLRLQQMGYTPALVQQAGRPASASTASPTAPSAPCVAMVRARVLAQFYYELMISLQAGLQAFEALYELGGRTADSGMAAVCRSMAEVARQGGRISDGMAHFPTVFPPGDVGLVRAGETGGFVVDALKELGAQIEADLEARRQCRRYVTYFCVMVGIALFITFPAIMTFGATARSAAAGGDSRTGLQVFLTVFGRMFLSVSIPVLLGFLLSRLVFNRWARTPSGRERWHRLILRLPWLGGLAVARSRAVFAAALRLLYHGGVTPGDSWPAASDAVPNLELGRRLHEQDVAIRAGGQFSDALQRTALYPPMDIGLLTTGERTGNVEEALARIAEQYHRQSGDALAQVPNAVRYVTLILGVVITFCLIGYGFYAYATGLMGAFSEV